MLALDANWFAYLVVIAMFVFMFALGLVSITDRDPDSPPAE